MDCDGNAGIFKRLKRFDERFGRIEAVRRVAEAQRNAERACGKLLEDAKLQVSKITAGTDGEPVEEPFDEQL